jgi:hypothetical protein
MIKFHKKPIESNFYFDELLKFLVDNKYPLEVCLMEDGTKLTEAVEYDATQNVLCGLVSPMDEETGIPKMNFYKAESASKIKESIENGVKAVYVQVVLAKPNVPGKLFVRIFFLNF